MAGNLLDGRFDEGESHSSFLNALKAWRGEPSTAADDTPKSVRFQDGDAETGTGTGTNTGTGTGTSTETTTSKKNNFFANIGAADLNVNCLPEPPTFNEGGTVPDQKLSDPKFGPKNACW